MTWQLLIFQSQCNYMLKPWSQGIKKLFFLLVCLFFNDSHNADRQYYGKFLKSRIGLFCSFGYQSLLFLEKHDYVSLLFSSSSKIIKKKINNKLSFTASSNQNNNTTNNSNYNNNKWGLDKFPFCLLSLVEHSIKLSMLKWQLSITFSEKGFVTVGFNASIFSVLHKGTCNSILPTDFVMLVLLGITRWGIWIRWGSALCLFYHFSTNSFSFSWISLEIYFGRGQTIADQCH